MAVVAEVWSETGVGLWREVVAVDLLLATGGGRGGVRRGRVGWDGDGRFLGVGFLGLGFWPNRCFGLVPLGVWALAI